MQYRQVVCLQGHDTLPNAHCDELLRPTELQACHTGNSTMCVNIRPLTILETSSSFTWNVKPFGEVREAKQRSTPVTTFDRSFQCSTTCGTGRRLRQVNCINSVTKVAYDDDYCTKLSQKPIEYETCNLDPCPTWIADPWSPVSFLTPRRNADRALLFDLRSVR